MDDGSFVSVTLLDCNGGVHFVSVLREYYGGINHLLCEYFSFHYDVFYYPCSHCMIYRVQ